MLTAIEMEDDDMEKILSIMNSLPRLSPIKYSDMQKLKKDLDNIKWRTE